MSHSLSGLRAPTLIAGYFGNCLWATGLLGLALLDGTAVNRVLNARVLRVLGRYSYSFYLWHQVPAPLFERLEGTVARALRPSWLGNAVGCLLVFLIALAIAVASFHLIELPFLRLKRLFGYDEPGQPGAKEESIDLGPVHPALHGPSESTEEPSRSLA